MSFIESIQKRDPADPSVLDVFLSYPGFHVMTVFHPLASILWHFKLRTLARLWAHIGRLLTGIEIHPQAQIGKNCFIDHGMGVVIGQTSVIGDNCLIYQGVTLGGKGWDDKRRHPIIGNNVMIGAHAQIIGPIRIGDSAHIGAGSVVLHDVAMGDTVAGNPANII